MWHGLYAGRRRAARPLPGDCCRQDHLAHKRPPEPSLRPRPAKQENATGSTKRRQGGINTPKDRGHIETHGPQRRPSIGWRQQMLRENVINFLEAAVLFLLL